LEFSKAEKAFGGEGIGAALYTIPVGAALGVAVIMITIVVDLIGDRIDVLADETVATVAAGVEEVGEGEVVLGFDPSGVAPGLKVLLDFLGGGCAAELVEDEEGSVVVGDPTVVEGGAGGVDDVGKREGVDVCHVVCLR
jgi:hypothetical protein